MPEDPHEHEKFDPTAPWEANIKRTYDEFQQESLESIRLNRTHILKVLSDAQQNDNQRQTIANQALQNAVETANMVGKQALGHRDLATDRQWNVDEVAELVAQTSTVKDAIAAAVAEGVSQAMANKS